MTKSDDIKIAGTTADGKIIIKNVYQFISTHGFVLDYLIDICADNNMYVDWIDYFESGVRLGMSPDRLLNRIRIEVGDVFGSVYRDQILTLLKYYISKGCKV